MVSVVALVLLAGTLGTGRLASRQPPVAPASPSTSTPTTTSVTRIPAAVDKAVKLEVQVHLGPSGLPDPFGMASDLSRVMQECEGGLAQVRMWAQVLGETWVLAAKEPLPGRNWICWSDGLWGRASGFAGHGGSKDRLKLLQASQFSKTIRGKGELAVVGGPVTREAVRLRILFQDGPPIDLAPSTPVPSSRSSSTPPSTCNQPRRPGGPSAWSPTTRPATASPSAGPQHARVTSVTARWAHPNHPAGEGAGQPTVTVGQRPRMHVSQNP
jgi:hypothetical protein